MSTPRPAATVSRRRTPLLAGGLVVLVLAGAAQLTAPDGGVAEPQSVRVASTDLSCPESLSSRNGSSASQISIVTPSNLVTAGGRAIIGTPKRPASIARLEGRTYAKSFTALPSTRAHVATAIGGRAPGFTVNQLTVSTATATHGLSSLECPQPDNDVWFIGTGSAVGHRSTLYLTDAETTTATVDVALFGKNGRIDAPAGLGLTVKAQSRRAVRLDRLAPGAGVLAVHLSVTSGRVGAAVFDSEVRGLLPRGSDWVPVAQPPATRVVVPGLANGKGTRRVSVLAPGEGTATVKLRLVGREGSFAPSGAASVEIDRGKVSTVDLGVAAESDDVAVVLESTVPLIAGVRQSTSSKRVGDLAFTAGAPALTAPAVVTGLRTRDGYGSALLLTAPDGPAKLTLQALRDGRPYGKPITVTVDADRTERVGFPSGVARGRGDPFAAVLTPQPGSGPVYGALVRTRTVGDAAGLTVSVLRDARIQVDVPRAQADLEVGLG